jgi:2-polyprenyl-6-methoxyphenol hydroxylase-like FAD-dependent oxidoreductase
MSAPTRSVLISGASVAGPALAFWLTRLGFAVTIVEKAPSLRPGGYAVDFRGTSMEALRRMGLLDAVRAQATNMGDMFYVNARGKKTARLPAAAFSGELEIMRGDLAQILYDATCNDAEYLFGDSIAALDDKGDRVTVRFESGKIRDFDFVVGADGVHSNTRAKAFGPESEFVRDLGMGVSIFTVPNRLGLDYSGQLYPAPGTVAGVYSARQNTEARALFYFRATPEELACREPVAQRAIVRKHFAGQRWQVPQLLLDMEQAPDFYFDSVAQVHLEHWSRGRVVLLGDAASCASPLSGMGTGIAMVGAYVLAHELAAATDHAAAFAAYQQKLMPFVASSQKFAQDAVGHMAPTGRLSIALHILVIRLLIPLMPVEAMLKDVLAAANSVTLEDYPSLQLAEAA